MVRVLDIISDYMRLRGWQHQRLDGSTPAAARHAAMEHFNKPVGVWLSLVWFRWPRIASILSWHEAACFFCLFSEECVTHPRMQSANLPHLAIGMFMY